jgi:ubiquinone/menaquinone biosynthesis C-methylase UbiE
VKDWYEEWFGEEYLALYPHRDDEEAREVAALIASRIDVEAGSPALDLACGSGRHQRALADRWWTVGLDLSRLLLRVARGEDAAAALVRADMRQLPFAANSFALVTNLFTSFGYFRDDQHHERVVAEVSRVTMRGGWFVLDFLNAPHVRRTLIPFDRRTQGSRIIEQTRVISDDGRFIRKTITVNDEHREFVERVRLFEPAELRDMLERCGFDVVEILGAYDGRPRDDESPRAIIVGAKR